jgi:SAM-dependent methyltransferase
MRKDDSDGLPRRLRLRYRHLKEKHLFYRQMRRMAGRPLVVPEPGPVQSRELALATSAMDASIDLIIACSVFTHIPLDLQMPWLMELKRILRPGGIFLCTVLGESYIEKMLSQKDREHLENAGAFELGPDHEAVSLSSRHTRQDDVFQTRAQVLDSFGAVFDILAYLERGQKLQNLLVLLRPESQQ